MPHFYMHVIPESTEFLLSFWFGILPAFSGFLLTPSLVPFVRLLTVHRLSCIHSNVPVIFFNLVASSLFKLFCSV
jgi:hypothetical protein